MEESKCQYENAYSTGSIKGCQDFYRRQGVYGVWGSFMNNPYLFVMQDDMQLWRAYIIAYLPEIKINSKRIPLVEP